MPMPAHPACSKAACRRRTKRCGGLIGLIREMERAWEAEPKWLDKIKRMGIFRQDRAGLGLKQAFSGEIGGPWNRFRRAGPLIRIMTDQRHIEGGDDGSFSWKTGA
jgi:hypothetical protein